MRAEHKKIYNQLKKAAQKHHELANKLGKIESEKYGFEFASTDSDNIIDTLNYGIADYPFEEYEKEMEFYKKSYDLNEEGNLKVNGIYELCRK